MIALNVAVSPDNKDARASTVLAAPTGGRHGVAHWLAQVGLFCMPALVLTLPSNLLGYGVLLLVSTLLAPELLWRARRIEPTTLKVMTALMLAVVALGVFSILLFQQGLRDVDNRSRFLVIPWLVLWVCALRPDMRWLWRGALAGLLGTFVLALVEVLQGAPRAELSTNAIVLADIVAMLMVLALSLRWRTGVARLSVLGVMLALGATLMLSVPELRHQLRLTELHSDVQRLEKGDADSSAGARVERLQVAWETFKDHPFTGVGIGQFDTAMQRLPVCRTDPGELRCHLGHAHNDLAEWTATQGLPGLLLLLAVYGVPLWVFVRLHRRSGRATFRGPAAAGIMIVVAYVLCGLTQSMFAHQMTASFYVTIVGLLAGLSMVEGARHRAAIGR